VSEITRYLIQKTPIGTMMKPNPEGNWVAFEDFDRITAERDAALTDLASANSDKEAYAQNAIDLRKRVDALQALLTAADERVVVLESVLRELLEGTGNSPSANKKYGKARAALHGSRKSSNNQIDRLKVALKFYAEREHYHFESGNWDTVSGEPSNILWNGDEPDFIEDGSVARAALKPAEGGGDE